MLPIVSIAGLMTILARLPRRSFLIGSAVAVSALLAFALFRPEFAVYDVGPKLASGFNSWVFPAAAAVLWLVLSVWRRLHRPGVLAFVACVPISGIVHYMGAWSA